MKEKIWEEFNGSKNPLAVLYLPLALLRVLTNIPTNTVTAHSYVKKDI